MFAQANSEHCRHKIFNADWIVDGERREHSLFQMIRNTTERSPDDVLSAYHDNSAVIGGHSGRRFMPDPADRMYGEHDEDIHILMKVETHNHPTAIPPIRERPPAPAARSATRRPPGVAPAPRRADRFLGLEPAHPRPRAALGGGFRQARAHRLGPGHHAGRPIGGAAFNNEFGRPNLCGYFRTFEMRVAGPGRVARSCAATTSPSCWPVAGQHPRRACRQGPCPPASPLVVLGGPAMLIGLGGGAASSMASGKLGGGSGFRLGAAGQPGDAAPLPGSDRPLLGAGRRQPHPFGARRGRRRPLQRPAGTGRTTPAAAAVSSCARSPTTIPACRPWRSGATSPRSATCWPSAEHAGGVQGDLRARALPLCRGRHRHTTRPTCCWATPISTTTPSTCPCRLLFGKPPRMHRGQVTDSAFP